MTYDRYASEAAPDIGTYAFNGRNLNEGYWNAPHAQNPAPHWAPNTHYTLQTAATRHISNSPSVPRCPAMPNAPYRKIKY